MNIKNKKIKIFMIASSNSFVKQPGGAQKSSLLLAYELKQRGADVTMVCFHKENRPLREFPFKGENVPIVEYKINKLALFILTPFLPFLYKILKMEAEDTDYLHFFNVQLDPLGGYYKIFNKEAKVISTLNNYCYISPNFECSINGKPVYKYNFSQKIISINELFKENFSTPIRLILLCFSPIFSLIYSLNLFLSRKIDNYVALSPSVKEIYELNGFRNIKVIPNMYDTIFWSAREEMKKKEKIILYVGRIKRSKGVENLIQGFKKTSLQSKGYILKIIGSGNNLSYLRDKYSSANILFLGKLSYLELQKEYAKAEIFVHPGLAPETFGRTILEAIQNSCKMLVSDIGEPPNIVKKKECIYKYDNIDELTNKLEILASKEGYGIVDKKRLEVYSPERVVNMYEEIYGEL